MRFGDPIGRSDAPSDCLYFSVGYDTFKELSVCDAEHGLIGNSACSEGSFAVPYFVVGRSHLAQGILQDYEMRFRFNNRKHPYLFRDTYVAHVER